MSRRRRPNSMVLIAFVVVSVAVVGFFTGLQAPMKITVADSSSSGLSRPVEQSRAAEAGVIPAVHYSEMAATSRKDQQPSQLNSLKSTVAPLAEIKITNQDKLSALEQRARNRAFNGAPPTVPHPIDQQTDAACIACHEAGAVTATIRIPRMSHQFLANCTQCHVESHSRHLPSELASENSFTGLLAPTAGPRAYPGAPPQIPHTTWMRSDCMSCHGYEGRHGIRTTHPWRSSCLQCHAPAVAMEQTLLNEEPQFLQAPEITGSR